MFVGLGLNTRGNYKCLFCNHKSWKSEGYGISHVESKHPKERADLLAERLQQAQNKPARIEYKEKVVYKDKPEPKYWYLKRGQGIYCSSCKQVQMEVGIPVGQTIENTPHTCGNRTLSLVLEVR